MTLHFIVFLNFENNNIKIGRLSTVIMIVSSIQFLKTHQWCEKLLCLQPFRYSTLLELGEKRKDMLEKSCKKFMLFREANELQQWIHEKESALTNEEVGSDLEQVEVLQKKFDDFQKVILSRVFKHLFLQWVKKHLHQDSTLYFLCVHH